MTPEEHRQEHIRLHKAFDELTADFLTHTEKLPSKTTVMELIKWSFQETIKPTERR